MIFSSISFFLFTFILIFLIKYTPIKYRIHTLLFSSVYFYAFWNPPYIILIGSSIIINYYLYRIRENLPRNIRIWLPVSLNLIPLIFYKYLNFILFKLTHLGPDLFDLKNQFDPFIPLAISFFTFQQIAFHMDNIDKKGSTISFRDYSFFVLYFPQLIAGPIVHHSEILPALKNKKIQINYENLKIGITLFTIGIIKKTVIADTLDPIVANVFETTHKGLDPSTIGAWIGALGYSAQLYFDFSGYADMAIGVSYIFNIKLPINFYSPYRSLSLIEFWKRWHITLSRFLRDYIYIPLGGNKKGKIRKIINIFTTMFIGGIWHGAGYTFIVWGTLHALGISINHVFRDNITKKLKPNKLINSFFFILTNIYIIIAWVYFRAENVKTANILLRKIFLIDPITFPLRFISIFGEKSKLLAQNFGHTNNPAYTNLNDLLIVVASFLLLYILPDTIEIIGERHPGLGKDLFLKNKHYIFNSLSDRAIGFLCGFLLTTCLMLTLRGSPFIYFQF